MSRRAAWVLVALCGWTLYVWVTRMWNMVGEDRSTAFVAVHAAIAAISIGFGAAAGWIGWQRLRRD